MMDFTTTEIVLVVVAVLLAALLALAGNTIVKMAKDARDSLPVGFQELIDFNIPIIRENADKGTQRLVELAEGTPNKLDDELAAFIRREVMKAIEEFNRKETAN